VGITLGVRLAILALHAPLAARDRMLGELDADADVSAKDIAVSAESALLSIKSIFSHYLTQYLGLITKPHFYNKSSPTSMWVLPGATVNLRSSCISLAYDHHFCAAKHY
jgi:hypothetical protein